MARTPDNSMQRTALRAAAEPEGSACGGAVPAVGEGIQFRCCFCDEIVARAGPDPVVLVIPLASGGSQELRCHRACLQWVLHPSVRSRGP